MRLLNIFIVLTTSVLINMHNYQVPRTSAYPDKENVWVREGYFA